MATEKTMVSPPPPAAPLPPPSSSSSYTSYPILAITIFGILTTAILLVSYYVFVIKCCMNGRHSDVIGRFSISRSRRHRRHQPPSTIYNTMTTESRGLGESAIRAIPTIRFKGSERNCVGKSFFHDCAICLSEFEEEERLRLLPNCAHAFHIDCIDTWLQTNANCPICRSDISRVDPVLPPLFMAHCLHDQNTVIDVRDAVIGHGDLSPRTELSIPSTTTEQQDPSPRKPDQWFLLQKKVRKLQHVSSMGDECIDVREKDEQFYPVQPMRRSISMDSSNDRKLSLAVQEILRRQQQQQNPQFKEEEGSSSSTSVLGGSSRFRRTFFSFGYGRSSRNVVLPIQFDP